MESDMGGGEVLRGSGRIFAVALIGCATAVPTAAPPTAAAAPSAAAWTKSSVSTDARSAATKAARGFLKSSRCPVKLGEVAKAGRVTKRNRARVVRHLVRNTWFVVRVGSACTGMSGLRGRRPPTAYLVGVNRETAVGDFVVRFRWVDAAGRSRRTLGLVRGGRAPRTKFEPVMSTYSRRAPLQVPGPTELTTSATAEPMNGPVVSKVSWKPWGSHGNSIAVNGFGRTVVLKNVYMGIYVDVSGHIAVDHAFANIESAWGFRVTSTYSSRIVGRDGMQCVELTVQTSWTTVVGPGSGSNKQVYTLCSDGSSSYVG